MDQIMYIKAIKTIEGSNVTGKPDDELAPADLAWEYLSVLMPLAYALLTRFDIEAYMIALQKFQQTPKLIHFHRLNALVRWTQKNPKTLTYMFMICAKRLGVHSDTGFRR